MRPLGDRVLVNPSKAEEKKNGIILVDTQKKQDTGKVILIGVKSKTIKEGDMVQFYPNSGIKIHYNGMDCLLLSEAHEVIAIL